jgi:hypothetical protein
MGPPGSGTRFASACSARSLSAFILNFDMYYRRAAGTSRPAALHQLPYSVSSPVVGSFVAWSVMIPLEDRLADTVRGLQTQELEGSVAGAAPLPTDHSIVA